MAKIDVQHSIEIDLTRDHKNMGWIHTHGMDKFNLPELEIREVPLILGQGAGAILNAVASYMINSGRTVKLGQTYQAKGELIPIEFTKLKPIVGTEDHYQVERWALVIPADRIEMYHCIGHFLGPRPD